MAYQFPPNIERLVKERMASGDYESEDDALCTPAWPRNEELVAVNDAIRDMEAGDAGRP
jgi:hypothetical protein